MRTGVRGAIVGWAAVLSWAAGCAPSEAGPLPRTAAAEAAPPARAQASRVESSASEGVAKAVAETPSEPRCDDPLPHFTEGSRRGTVCPAALSDRGLTALDLSDDWVPRVLAAPPGAPEGGPAYRHAYVALANGQLPEHRIPSPAGTAPYLELYGVFASFGVIRGLVVDGEHHRCHDAVEDRALDALDIALRPWGRFLTRQRIARRNVRWLEQVLSEAVERKGLERIDDLEGDRIYGSKVERYRREKVTVDAVKAVQGHLACDGLLQDPPEPGVLGPQTARALEKWQRMHAIVSFGVLDGATRRALRTDSRELVFRLLLRTLRARVVDATGLIEDGTAASAPEKVLGRWLDPPEFRKVAELEPLPHAAPDRVARATERAARALGWTSPERARDFFAALPEGTTDAWRVALPLPAPPSYHSRSMRLRAVLDRGDIWYEFPYTSSGNLRHHPVDGRPVLILYAQDGERSIPLVRWNTTIGGWKPEQTPAGRFGLRYKESPAGPRLWRHLVAAPVWLPPPSTPDEELLTREPGQPWRPKWELLGPGYASAYGMLMLVHHKPRKEDADDESANVRAVNPEEDSGDEAYLDEGIRTHGSVSYHSILEGYSHGCHRLYNHLALRLGGFLLAHRSYTVHGPVEVRYGRTLRRAGQRTRVRIESRGYLYELTPPVPVEVTEGRILGRRKKAPNALMPLRENLVERAREDAERDAP